MRRVSTLRLLSGWLAVCACGCADMPLTERTIEAAKGETVESPLHPAFYLLVPFVVPPDVVVYIVNNMRLSPGEYYSTTVK